MVIEEARQLWNSVACCAYHVPRESLVVRMTLHSVASVCSLVQSIGCVKTVGTVLALRNCSLLESFELLPELFFLQCFCFRVMLLLVLPFEILPQHTICGILNLWLLLWGRIDYLVPIITTHHVNWMDSCVSRAWDTRSETATTLVDQSSWLAAVAQNAVYPLSMLILMKSLTNCLFSRYLA